MLSPTLTDSERTLHIWLPIWHTMKRLAGISKQKSWFPPCTLTSLSFSLILVNFPQFTQSLKIKTKELFLNPLSFIPLTNKQRKKSCQLGDWKRFWICPVLAIWLLPANASYQDPFPSGLLQWGPIWCFAFIVVHPSKMWSWKTNSLSEDSALDSDPSVLKKKKKIV